MLLQLLLTRQNSGGCTHTLWGLLYAKCLRANKSLLKVIGDLRLPTNSVVYRYQIIVMPAHGGESMDTVAACLQKQACALLFSGELWILRRVSALLIQPMLKY